MDIRSAATPLVRATGRSLARLNARHPWDHNEHFHRWVLANLPPHAERVLDVGCGRGGLVATLRTQVAMVEGVDADPAMAALAASRHAGDPGVRIRHADFLGEDRSGSHESGQGAPCSDDVTGPFDAVTMIASLHHMDLEPALERVRELLRPGGRLLAVTLTRPAGLVDGLWDLGNVLTNPLIGVASHPRAVRGPARDQEGPQMPVRDAELSLAAVRRRGERVLPGMRARRRVGFRATLRWDAPA